MAKTVPRAPVLMIFERASLVARYSSELKYQLTGPKGNDGTYLKYAPSVVSKYASGSSNLTSTPARLHIELVYSIA
jgi:hypothetical protein